MILGLDFSKLKVALVHDWLVSRGGGERVLKTLHDAFPHAPIYTLVYDGSNAPSWTKECDIRTTYIQKWPGAKSHHKMLLGFMPKAWESLDFSGYDLVISSCSSCCKGIITGPETLHVCLCYSPTRYLWDLYYEYLENASAFKRPFIKSVVHKVRMWDYLAAQRPNIFVADSDFVGKRISKFYRRESITLHPGLSCESFRGAPAEPEDYYLVVSRFVRYKRVDLAIEACNLLGRHLVVIGSGGEEESDLKSIAGDTVEFVGQVSDEELRRYYSHAKAFLFPGLEDYGLTPVEAQAAGTPVLAFGQGGALETVVNGETGLFFFEQTPESVAACIESFEGNGVSCSREDIKRHASRFSEEEYMAELKSLIEEGLKQIGKEV